jgi:tRNA pseudouridine38-40 synthase
MPRYALRLAYKGSQYAGWQIQENAPTVQARIQHALSIISGEEISLSGCGRTDTGVHATNYIAHFDAEQDLIDNFLYRINRILPKDITILDWKEVDGDFHARFSARKRTYKYLLDFNTSIFMEGLYYYCPYVKQLDTTKLNEAASVLMEYESFYPFCKSKVEVDHYKCEMMQSEWSQIGESRWIYTVKANRFLRGMVRLIVGMCINVGRGKLSLSDVRTSLEQQERMAHPWSAPAEGLYLYDIDYDEEIFTKGSPNRLFFPI